MSDLTCWNCGHSLADVKDQLVLDVFEDVVLVRAPAGAEDWDGEQLLVRPTGRACQFQQAGVRSVALFIVFPGLITLWQTCGHSGIKIAVGSFHFGDGDSIIGMLAAFEFFEAAFPNRIGTHSAPGDFDHRPTQQPRAFLADLQLPGLAGAFPAARVEPGVGNHSLGAAETSPVTQLAEHHVDRHRTDLGGVRVPVVGALVEREYLLPGE